MRSPAGQGHIRPPVERLTKALTLAALGTACCAALAAPTLMPDAARTPSSTHEDGVAKLQVMVEGNLMTVRLTSPLHNLSGLRTAPRNEVQRIAVRAMAAKLRDAHDLFAPTEAAACVVAAVALASAVIAPDLLQPPGSPTTGSTGMGLPAHNSAGSREAADLAAVYLFRCDKPQSLAGLQVKLFERFPSLVQVDAEITTGKGESGARLSPNRHVLTW